MMMLGFLFESWTEVHRHLTKEEFPSDSSAVERYAKTLGLDAIVLDGSLFLGELLGKGSDFPFGKYLAIPLSDFSAFEADAADIKEKIEATGLQPDGDAVVFVIEYDD